MPTRIKQSGSALIVTMMIMVIMAITGLALLRAVDTGNLVAGNIGFKQAAIISADSALKDSANFLSTATLTADSAADGYYATGNRFMTGPDKAHLVTLRMTWIGMELIRVLPPKPSNLPFPTAPRWTPQETGHIT